MKARQLWVPAFVAALLVAPGALYAQTPVGTAFTYQGQLKKGGAPVSDENARFEFSLWDAPDGGSPVCDPIMMEGVQVVDGLFTVKLDFGAGIFATDARWLQIAVECCGDPLTPLTPRQELTPTPYALALPGLWTQQSSISPNLVGGWSGNTVAPGVVGATIGGGGTPEDLDGDGSPDVNRVLADYATVAGGAGNVAGDERGGATGTGATVGGGVGTNATGPYSTVSGGLKNNAQMRASTVGGGELNLASGQSATVGGGYESWATHNYATVGGGYYSRATDQYATVGGGYNNEAASAQSTVAGGHSNEASHYNTTVAGGRENAATGDTATIGGGFRNTAGGMWATVPGGHHNQALGECSLAAGANAWAGDVGSFVWADNTGSNLYSKGTNSFVVRACGGTWIYSNAGLTAGVKLPPGASYWDEVCDRNLKANFRPVDGRDVLERLASIPLSTWNYKSQDPSVRHIGPMAQDFYAAFGVGTDERHISSMDAGGVALVAIQGMYQIVQEKDAEIDAMKKHNEKLEARLAAVEALLTELAEAENGGVR